MGLKIFPLHDTFVGATMDCAQSQDFMMENLVRDEAQFHPEFHSHLELCPACEREWQDQLEVAQKFADLEPVLPSLSSLRYLQQRARLAPTTLWSSLWENCRRWFDSFFPHVLHWAPVFMIVVVVLTTCVVMFSASPWQPDVATNQVINHPMAPQQKLIQPNLPLQPVAQMPMNQPSHQISTPNFLAELPALPTLDPVLPSTEPSLDLEKQYQLRIQSLLEADADELLMRGRRFKSMGRMDLALRDFETIHSFYPKYTYMGDVLMYRAQCYGFQGEVDKAVVSLQEYAKLYPEKDSLVLSMIKQLESSRP